MRSIIVGTDIPQLITHEITSILDQMHRRQELTGHIHGIGVTFFRWLSTRSKTASEGSGLSNTFIHRHSLESHIIFYF